MPTRGQSPHDIPRFEGNLSDWAEKLVRYFEGETRVRGEVQPQAILLVHQVDGLIARAIEDGMLMYDPVRLSPVVSVGGVWKAFSFTDHLHDDRYTRWLGVWSDSVTYHENAIVLDWPYLAIANKTTTDRPAPQPAGAPFWAYQGTSPVATITAKALDVFTDYVFGRGGFITQYRVYTTIGSVYTVYVVSSSGAVTQLQTFTADTDGWVEFFTNDRVVTAGEAFRLGVTISEPPTTPIVVTLSYDYQTPNHDEAPTVGVILHSGKTLSSLRVNKTDQNGDQSAVVEAMVPGDVISGAGTRWVILAAVDNTTWVDFTVTPASQGSPNGIQDFDFEAAVATPIATVVDHDYWLANPSASGGYSIDGGAEVITQSAYGIDIQVQEASVSEDWELMAISGGATDGGGSGVPEAPQDYHMYARGNAAWNRDAVEPHSDQADYEFDDLVSYGGTIWHCIIAHTAAPFSLTNWSPIASAMGTGVTMSYRWSTLISGDPGNGFFAITDAMTNPTNTIRVSGITEHGNDLSSFWSSVDEGDAILFVEDTGGAESGIWVASAPAVDMGGWYSIAVNYVNSVGEPEDNRKGFASIVRNPNDRLPSGGLEDQILAKRTDTNYDTEWRYQHLAEVHATVIPGSDPALTNAINVASITLVSDTEFDIVFSTPLANDFYHASVVPVAAPPDYLTAHIFDLTSAGFSVTFQQDAYGGPQRILPTSFTVRVT